MISYSRLNTITIGRTLLSDEVVEFHAARMLILIFICGTKDIKMKVPRIKGLTRLAKLDFFVRYPEHFKKAAKHLGKTPNIQMDYNESKMIRHHYGPWDKRYYHVLSYLESKNLIQIIKQGNTYEFYLTNQGNILANKLSKMDSFLELSGEIKEVNKVFKKFSGNKLKELIYDLFIDDVSDKPLGETI